MHALAIAVIALALRTAPVELPRDVVEIQARRFDMPLSVDPDRRDTIKTIRLFVSKDCGKNWEHEKDYKPDDKQVTFEAARDGQYWFALQVEFKDGKREPEKAGDVPCRKVYVNAEHRVLKAQKSFEDLKREVEELRKTIDQLQKRIRALEAGK
jgi:hypothetical protein